MLASRPRAEGDQQILAALSRSSQFSEQSAGGTCVTCVQGMQNPKP